MCPFSFGSLFERYPFATNNEGVPQ
jgi:hypothetical protein